MKVIFFGTSAYCLPLLESINGNFDLSAIITKSGESPVLQYATEHKKNYFTLGMSKDIFDLNPKITDLKPDLGVVADFGFIIPRSIFAIPKHKTINIHFSNLPELRGSSPVQYSILFGIKNPTVAVIKMDQSVDTGDILKIINYPEINIDSETTKTLYEKLFQTISEDLPQIIRDYTAGKINAVKQKDSDATFTRRLKREDGYIPFNVLNNFIRGNKISISKNDFPKDSLLFQAFMKSDNSALTLCRALRAFEPWPNVFTELPNKKRLKIFKAYCRESRFFPESVQLEGKNEVTWKQFLEGYPEIKRHLFLP